ncbi:hypothetical protein GKZ27_11405 [Enterorhabdus mucosicola]|uniref:Uncharacterized protein n=1 Tax=Adlercreutzia mucosicola TaxID=580026 RepID=A0A6N8JQE8_9ACTN|nr:hypothetical protein [Adlercreutzia mucosicola]MVX62048.1 hypothetical protein [Adlercreutzia mucosicola]
MKSAAVTASPSMPQMVKSPSSKDLAPGVGVAAGEVRGAAKGSPAVETASAMESAVL